MSESRRTAIDIAPKMLERAHRRAEGEGVDVRLNDTFTTPRNILNLLYDYVPVY